MDALCGLFQRYLFEANPKWDGMAGVFLKDSDG